MAKAKSEVKSTLINTFDRWIAVRGKISDLDSKREPLEEEAAILKAALIKMIPPNKTKEGIYHKHFVRKNTSWSEVISQVRGRLVPKSRQEEVDVIISQNTKEISIDTFAPEDV